MNNNNNTENVWGKLFKGGKGSVTRSWGMGVTPSGPVLPEIGAEFLLNLLWKQSLVMYSCL